MKLTDMRKLSINLVIVSGIATAAVILVSLFANWVVALDAILAVGLFATLAGLSLAGGAFLQGPIGEQKSIFEFLNDKEIKSRPSSIDELNKAENWYKERIYPADPKKCGCSFEEAKKCINIREGFEAQTKVYLINRINTRDARIQLLSLRSVQINFIKSFNYFALGMIEGVTLDVIASTNKELESNPGGFLNLWYSKPISPALSTLDIMFSVTLLFLGMLALYNAGLGLKKQAWRYEIEGDA